MELNRRQFLQTTGGALLTLGAASSISLEAEASSKPNKLPPPITLDSTKDVQTEQPDKEMPNMMSRKDRVGFAIVGLGHFALSTILPAFAQSQRCKPVALVSGHPDKAFKVAAQYGIDPKNIYSYENFESMQANPEIEIVYIVLPPKLHAEFTIRSAKAGKHVLCEKPMATSLEEAQSLITACKQAGKKLMIAYRMQYDLVYKKLRENMDAEKYGKIKFIGSTFGFNTANNNQWRLKKNIAGGGSLPDVGVYCINTARFLLNEEPIEVLAHKFSTPNDPRFKEVEELAHFSLMFPSGAIVSATCSYGIYKFGEFHICGTNSSVQINPAFPDHETKPKIVHKISEESEATEEFKISSHKNQFAEELDHMAWCVTNDYQPFTPGEEGLQDQKIMQAIYKSAELKQPVKLEHFSGKDIFRGKFPE